MIRGKGEGFTVPAVLFHRLGRVLAKGEETTVHHKAAPPLDDGLRVDQDLYRSQVWRHLLDGGATRAELAEIDAPKLIRWQHEHEATPLVAAYRILRLLGRMP